MIFNKLQRVLGVSGGGIVIVSAFMIMWSGVAKNLSTESAVDRAISQAIEIDTSIPDPSNNGQLVMAAGKLTSSDTYEDELLKPSELLIVRRRSEMLQWVEVLKGDKEQPLYSMSWVEGQVEFFNFKVPQGHENPLLQIEPREYRASKVRFGGFDGSRLLSLIKRLEPLTLTPELLKDPTHAIVDNKVVVRRTPGSSDVALGDMRVWYEVVPSGEYTFLVQQNDERSLVGATVSREPFVLKGSWLKENFSEGLSVSETTGSRTVLLLGAGLLFFGLLSVLMPHAARFDLSPRINVRGRLAVVVVSAGVSLVVTMIFVALSFTN